MSSEDAPQRIGALTLCLTCIVLAEAEGEPMSGEIALSLIKQAIKAVPLAGGPRPERVGDAEAEHAAGGFCITCRFDVAADEVKLNHGDGRVICLRCFARETGSEKTMSKELREQLQAILSETN